LLDKVRSIGSGRKGGRASAYAAYRDGSSSDNSGDSIEEQVPMRVRSYFNRRSLACLLVSVFETNDP
jgi:hypothetical protein